MSKLLESIKSSTIKVVYPIQEVFGEKLRCNCEYKNTDQEKDICISEDSLGDIKGEIYIRKCSRSSKELETEFLKNNQNTFNIKGFDCNTRVLKDASWGWWQNEIVIGDSTAKNIWQALLEIEKTVHDWIEKKNGEVVKKNICYPVVCGKKPANSESCPNTKNNKDIDKNSSKSVSAADPTIPCDLSNEEDKGYRFVSFGSSDCEGTPHISEPYFIIECVLAQDSISETDRKEIIQNNDLKFLTYRPYTENFKEINPTKEKNQAFSDRWMCFFSGRSLVIFRSEFSSNEKTEKGNIKRLIKDTTDAVSYIWAMTGVLHGLSCLLDDWLKKVGKNLRRLSNGDTNGKCRVAAIREILEGSSDIRRQFAFILMDPTAYAFPAGTIHRILKLARCEFGTIMAKEKLDIKFNVVDRVMEDLLQLSALPKQGKEKGS